MVKKKPIGWRRESVRHSLARKGIKTGHKSTKRGNPNKQQTIKKDETFKDELKKIKEITKLPKDCKLSGIKDIVVPHPYMITPKHLEYSEGMYLDVEGAEKKGAVCGICRRRHKKFGEPILSYSEHKQERTLFIEVPKNDNLNKVEGLHNYLLKIKPTCEKLGITGFAFPKKRKGEMK